MNTDKIGMIARLTGLGFAPSEIAALQRISRTLRRWYELECGDGNDRASWAIERDEKTDRPYMVTYPHRSEKPTYRRIADRENGARRRLESIMSQHPDLTHYVQTDPRGESLYIMRAADVAGKDVDCCYSSFGVAVY
jgi:hypothetical protein